MKTNDIDSLNHTSRNCKYHIVFAPKYRRRVAYGKIRVEIGKILRELCTTTTKFNKGVRFLGTNSFYGSANADRVSNHATCVMVRCADTGLVPPARGVMVNAVAFPAGFRTVRMELMTVVVT
jgi:hypothetical protein